MPFDGVDFQEKKERPERSVRADKVVALVVVVLGFILLIMPISAAGLIDIVQYIRGR